MKTHVSFRLVPSSMAMAVLCAANAQAAYTGVSVEKHTTVTIGGLARDVYRVYANFTNPLDRLHASVGTHSLGPLSIQNRNSDDTAFGSGFVSTWPLTQAPTLEQISLNPDVEWDSFFTIGLSIADQAPYGDQMLTLAIGGISNGMTDFFDVDGGWFLAPLLDHDNDDSTPDIPSPQAEAGFLGDGDSSLRVLYLQLTVNAGENVRGTMHFSIHDHDINSSYTVVQQTFNSIPAPPAFALLGMAVLAVGRRRRCDLLFEPARMLHS